jgi:branched-chain amino acid transport system ATP-binding protein
VTQYFPWIAQRRRQIAATLSGGEQQMLAMARTLMMRPKLLLVDEPSLGLAPIIVREIFDIVRQLNKDERITVLVVEQNANIALRAADAGYVLEVGRVVLEGRSEELLRNESVRRSYLGY